MVTDVLSQENAVMNDVRCTDAPAIPIEDARILLQRLDRQEAMLAAMADDARRQRDLRRKAEEKLQNAYDYTGETIRQFNVVLAENRKLRNEPEFIEVPE